MAKLLLIQQSARQQLRDMKGLLTPAKYDTFKSKIISAGRVSTVNNLQAKLSKVVSAHNEHTALKQQLLGTLQQSRQAMEAKAYAKMRASIQKSKTIKTLNKHYDNLIPLKTIYLSGKASVRNDKNYQYDDTSFNITLKVSSRLNPQELQQAIDVAVGEHWQTPRDGVYGKVVFHKTQVHDQPTNFIPASDMFINLPKPLKLKLMEQVGEITYNRNENCVINYLHNELQKVFIKHDIKKLETRIAKLGYDPEKGMTLELFQKVMLNYPYISYTVLSPTFSLMGEYSAKEAADHQSLRLTFYVNNGHLYPINSPNIQHQIELHKKSLRPFIQTEVQKFRIPSEYCYMEEPEVHRDFGDMEQKDGINIIINKATTINELLNAIIQLTEHAPEYIKVNEKNGAINCFKHPTLDIYFHQYDDWHNRAEAYRLLNQKYGGLFGKFRNQTYSQIGQELMKLMEKLPPSYYNKEAHHLLNTYEPKAIMDCNKTIVRKTHEDPDNELELHIENPIQSIDAYKQFSTIFYKLFQREGFLIPVYDIHNRVLSYDNSPIRLGEYYVENMNICNIRLFGCFLHSHVVSELMTLSIIKPENIKYMINTTHGYKPEVFKTFVETTATLGDSAFKKINNCFNGSLKNSKVRKGDSYFTNDMATACFIIDEAEKSNKKFGWSLMEETGYYFLNTFAETPNYENTSSFYRACVSCSIMQIVSTFGPVCKVGTIVKVQADAIYYEPYDQNKLLTPSPITKGTILDNLGKFTSSQEFSITKQKQKTILEYVPFEVVKKDTLTLGAGGCGKSYSVIQQSDKNAPILFVSTTNNAVMELQQKTVEIHKKVPAGWKFLTFAMLATINQQSNFRILAHLHRFARIVVDEAFMTNNKYMRLLKVVDVPVSYLGDDGQLGPIYSSEQPCNDPVTNMFYDCEIIRKPFDAEHARYDQKSFKIFDTFTSTGKGYGLKKLPAVEKDKIYPFYLCATNDTRKKFTKLCTDHFCEEGKEFKFAYQGKSETYKLKEGAPVICTKNNPDLKKIGIANNWKGHISHIASTGELITVKGILYDEDSGWSEGEQVIMRSEFVEHFLPLYVSTIHKFQGGVIKGEYAILEMDQYMSDRNVVYTSITRCTDFKNVHIDHSRLKATYYPTRHPQEVKAINTKVEEATIYKVEYECKCADDIKKVYGIADLKPDLTKLTAEDIKAHGINKKHARCSYTITRLLPAMPMNKHMQSRLTVAAEEEGEPQVERPQEVKIIKDFKPQQTNTRYETKVYECSDHLRVVYYDMNLEKKVKEMKFKQCGIEEARQKAKDFVRMTKISGLPEPRGIITCDTKIEGECKCGVMIDNICNCANPRYSMCHNKPWCDSCSKWKCRCNDVAPPKTCADEMGKFKGNPNLILSFA